MPFRRRRFPVKFIKRRRGAGFRRRRATYKRRRRTVRRNRPSRPEVKIGQSATGSNIFNSPWGSGAKQTTDLISQGIGATQRIGQVVCVKKIQFLIDVSPNAATALPVEYCRLVVWLQRNAVGAANCTDWADLYDQSVQASNAEMCVWGIRKQGNRDFRIIHDKRFTMALPLSPHATASNIRHTRRITIRFRRGLRVLFGPAAGQITTETGPSNQIWFNTLGEQGAVANYPRGAVTWKLWWTDM